MKEKTILFIALSFLIGLTAYKRSLDNTIKLANETQNKQSTIIEHHAENIDIVSNNKIDYLDCNNMTSNTDDLQFNEAFKYYRNCNHDTFIWNGLEYTTILKSEVNERLQKLSTNKMDLVSK